MRLRESKMNDKDMLDILDRELGSRRFRVGRLNEEGIVDILCSAEV